MVAFTQEDVEQALDQIDTEGIPRNRRSTDYCLIAREKHYPPKHVLRIVYLKKGQNVSGLRSSEKTRRELKQYGYTIEKHGCGNTKFKITD